MARVNFEEHGFGDGRLSRLARALGEGVSFREAVGTLTVLWHDSQEELRVSGTKEEIIDWCRAESDAAGDTLFAALLKAKYLTLIETGKLAGQYEIRGNKIQIESRMKNLERAKKGGRSTHEKWSRLKKDNETEDLTEGLKPSSLAGFKPSNTDQIRSVQSSTDQINKIRSSDEVENPPSPAERTEINRLAWTAYIAAYKKRHNHDPTRNKTVNAQMANFVRRVGGADAPGIAAFYVAHNDFLYVKSMHPVSLMLRDAEGLRTQWLNNRAVTSADARQTETSDRFRSQIERIKAGEV